MLQKSDLMYFIMKIVQSFLLLDCLGIKSKPFPNDGNLAFFLTFPLPQYLRSINKTQAMFYNVCSLSHVLLRVLFATVIILYSWEICYEGGVENTCLLVSVFSDARIRNIPSVRIYIYIYISYKQFIFCFFNPLDHILTI